MDKDDKHGSDEDEELTPHEDAESPRNEGEKGVPEEESDFSLEGELVPGNGHKEQSGKDESADSAEGGDDTVESDDHESVGDDDFDIEEDEPTGADESDTTDTDDSGDSEDDDGYVHSEQDETNPMDEEEEAITPYHVDEPVHHEDEDLALLDETVHHGHMTFLEHLEELRIVLFKSAAAFLISFIIIAVFFKKINALIRMPLERAMENHGVTEALVTTSPFGIFSFLLQMGFMGGLTLSSPFILYFAASFIAPGLNKKEKRALLPGALAALFLLCLGGAFSYTVLIPSALNVSIYFNEMMGVSLMWAADRYMSLLLWMILGVGLLFEFPLIIAVAVYVGLLTQQQLRTFRRYAIVIIFILAAFITPTQDPITMMLMALPLMALYEGSILIGGLIERRKRKAYEAEFGAWDEDEENRNHHD